MTLFLQILALPFGIVYWLITSIRNLGYSLGIMPSKSYNFPLICIGNLSVGGTGKTPHTEYLIRLLQGRYSIATLSRGYGRSTKGYRLANEQDNAKTIGDEPYQLFQKFPKIKVAVAEKRKLGIQNLMELKDRPELILLDDAYQHRSVKADLNILLTEYHKPYHKDFIMPIGRLRESRKGAQRADIIVVSKSPSSLTPLEMRSFTMDLELEDYQEIFFSYLEYQALKPLNQKAKELEVDYKGLKDFDLCLLTAIAKPEEVQKFIRSKNPQVDCMSFPDHYFFREKDYFNLQKKFANLTKNKLLLTTEKDASKLDLNQLESIPVFVIPIQIAFHDSSSESIDFQIEQYVKSYQGKH